VWPAPFTYSVSPLGNELASIYGGPVRLESVIESKDAEQIANSTPESNAFLPQAEDALKAGDYQLAARAWRHAVVDDPRNGTTIMMLAQVLFAAGDYDEAAAAVYQAMTLLPEHEWGNVASKFRGLYANIQDYTDQVTALAKAVEKYPNDPALRLELGFQYAYSGHPDLAVPQLDKLLELVPQDQIGRKLRDQVNKEKKSTPSPAG
jgi:Flp pilus assembly protein TadD